MDRRASTFISIGISFALIAIGIWFLYNHHRYFGLGGDNWIMPHHMMRGGGMGMIMMLFWVALLTAVILLISGLITRRHDSDQKEGPPLSGADALDILKRRYARGEISKIEYENMRQDLLQ